MKFADFTENDLLYCYWCKESIDIDEPTTRPGARPYGHLYCLKLSQQGLTNKAIRRKYLRDRQDAEKYLRGEA